MKLHIRQKSTENFFVCLVTLLILFCSSIGAEIYTFSKDPIDVVIPCVEKDLETLELCISGIRTHGKNIRRIIIVSSNKLSDSAEWFDESNFPFSIKDVALYLFKENAEKAEKYLLGGKSRVGWYYQQLLKFYAPFVIPNISSNVLVLDADTVFLNPVCFLNSKGGGLLNPSSENHFAYFEHAKRLTGNRVGRLYQQYSGISHHMIFQKPLLEDLFDLVETLHNQEFWKAFCLCVDEAQLFAGASEYEIYFNFALSQTKQVEIRPLRWANISNLNLISFYRKKHFHYVSCHDWGRQ